MKKLKATVHMWARTQVVVSPSAHQCVYCPCELGHRSWRAQAHPLQKRAWVSPRTSHGEPRCTIHGIGINLSETHEILTKSGGVEEKSTIGLLNLVLGFRILCKRRLDAREKFLPSIHGILLNYREFYLLHEQLNSPLRIKKKP